MKPSRPRIPQPASFWICLVTSVALIIASFFVPPMGVIDGSVLAAVGELFGFGALGILFKSIQLGYSAKVTHGSTAIELKDETDE